MKYALLFLMSSTGFAKGKIAIPFPDISHQVLVQVEKGPCTVGGKNPLILKTQTENTAYSLECKIAKPEYSSSTPVKLMQAFEFPKSILERIDAAGFQDLKNKDESAIEQKKHPWGREFWWSTPTKGAMIYTYLCPKGANACIEISHGEIERLKFDVKPYIPK